MKECQGSPEYRILEQGQRAKKIEKLGGRLPDIMSLHRALGGLEQQWSRAYEQHAGCEAIALTIHTREPLDLGLATVPLLTTLP